jgi:hypothetical protein
MNEILPETQRDWSNGAQSNLKRFITSKLRFKPVYLNLLLRASLIDSSIAVICTGTDRTMNLYLHQGPTSFNGMVSISLADSVSGIPTALSGTSGFPIFAIDTGCTPGTPITSTATFNSTTLGALGFTTTGLLGTWTLQPLNGSDLYTANDTIQVVIGAPPPAAVPGPLPLLGAGAAFGWARRLRKRTQLL